MAAIPMETLPAYKSPANSSKMQYAAKPNEDPEQGLDTAPPSPPPPQPHPQPPQNRKEPTEDSCATTCLHLLKFPTQDTTITFFVTLALVLNFGVAYIFFYVNAYPKYACEHHPALVDFHNGIFGAMLTIAPYVLLNTLFQFVSAQVDGRTLTLRGLMDTFGRRLALIWFMASMCMIVGPWTHGLNKHLECGSDYMNRVFAKKGL